MHQPADCLHTRPYSNPLSGTTRVSRYQKKHSPTHSHEEEEEAFAQTTRSALSQRVLLDPMKPAYNQSRPLKLTASAFNRLWISTLAVLVTVPTVMQNSLHPLSTSSITARHLLEFMMRRKITEADAPTIRLDATPSQLSCALTSIITPFLRRMPYLPQPSQFILAWDRHRMMLACIPSGLVHAQWLV